MKGGRFTQLHAFGVMFFLAFALAAPHRAGASLDTSDPLGFFTNLASRLLKSELNLSLTRIQIFPTNQYTPAVHRLLQVTANLLDATTNRFNTNYPFLPSVFRPLFTNDGGSIFICGYTEAGTNALTNAWRDVTAAGDRIALQPTDYVDGVPVVIGAKKGFPNFNEFAMQSVIQITRKLQITRPSIGAPRSSYQTNQMFIVGISNVLGVEAWNSYRSNYTRAVDIIIADMLTMALTNDYGLTLTQQAVLPGSLTIALNAWPAFNINTTNSFLVPLRTNLVFLPDSVYQHGAQSFTNLTAPFETGVGFPIPQWRLLVTNRLRGFMVDRDTQRLVDFVTLEGLSSVCNLGEEISDPDNALGFAGLWSTNRIGGDLPQGIVNQIEISLGRYGNRDWNSYGFNLPPGATLNHEIDSFRALYGLSPLYYPGTINTNLAQLAPFTPTRKASQYLTWQVNDPLVHSLPTDLSRRSDFGFHLLPGPPILTVANVGRLNDSYQPWAGNPYHSTDPNRFNPALKDPLIRNSDDWNFPDAEPLSFERIGRVHRDTPWQTVFLKSATVDLPAWESWIGHSNDNEARLSMPTNDWRIAGLLASLLNTNDPRQLLSVSDPNTNAWLSVLDGLSVLTNSSSDAQFNVQFDTLIMAATSPQAALIAGAIQDARGSQPGQHFHGLGDLLAAPELSVSSPWLNRSSTTQLQKGISDEAYEKIPSQLLPLLRPDSIGSLIQTGEVLRIQFTGFDDYAYAVELSSDLVNWSRVSTNHPANGVFEFVGPSPTGAARRFYRSALLP